MSTLTSCSIWFTVRICVSLLMLAFVICVSIPWSTASHPLHLKTGPAKYITTPHIHKAGFLSHSCYLKHPSFSNTYNIHLSFTLCLYLLHRPISVSFSSEHIPPPNTHTFTCIHTHIMTDTYFLPERVLTIPWAQWPSVWWRWGGCHGQWHSPPPAAGSSGPACRGWCLRRFPQWSGPVQAGMPSAHVIVYHIKYDKGSCKTKRVCECVCVHACVCMCVCMNAHE